jgi:signal transduction histidine kinase
VLVRDGAFVTVWRTTTTGTTALVGPASALMAHANLAMLPVEIGLTDSTGRTLWGAPQRDDAVSRALQDVGLPLTLHVAMTDVAATLNASRQRWNLLGAGFGLMVLVIVAASCLVFRSVSRELAVAHLRSDFVATVSHEFRTPLAAMRHLTELLEDGGASAEKLGDYYRALGKETRRLQGMVEHLLDFGRMEAGRRGYQLREMDASALVRETVQEFREQAGSALRELQLTTPLEGPRIRADRAALVLAIRNLLDNAVKYSPASSPVTVSVARDSRGVSIAVEDQGPGISREEQRAVFRKFVRGTAAKALNVQGTGIGLTMAQRVARAHGGRIELMSTPGGGSRFTILLPAEIP